MALTAKNITRALVAALVVAALVAALVAVGGSRGSDSAPVALTDGDQVTVWAVGDGADGSDNAKAVAAMVEAGSPDLFLYLGDVYEKGTAEEFAANYETTFGPLKEITLPTPGNHDWPNHEQGYDPYFEGVVSEGTPHHYSREVAGWQLLSINSESGIKPGTEQVDWLAEQVASGGDCRIAVTHRPRYSGGTHGDQENMATIWDLLAGRAKLFLSGHEHNMQRLEPIDGITTLINGAGGKERYNLDGIDSPRLAFGDSDNYGAIRLQLEPGRATWEFVALDGRILDSGKTDCQA